MTVSASAILKQKRIIVNNRHENLLLTIRNATSEGGLRHELEVRTAAITQHAAVEHSYSSASTEPEALSPSLPNSMSSDIYYCAGDNFDITVSPTYITANNQRRSYHWFLAIGIKKRISNPALPDISPQKSITDMSCSSWVVSQDELNLLAQNFNHHVVKVIMRFDCVKRFDITIPEYIVHPHMNETAQKTEFDVVDLMDCNENDSDGMIRIMKHLHKLFVPQTRNEHPNALQRTEFAGDVLTNERAFGVQCAMDNGEGTVDRLAGFNFRPGGLHILMNLCVVIDT